MTEKSIDDIVEGAYCEVTGGTHRGKSGTIADVHMSKGGNLTITVIQVSGVRFKTLGKNVKVIS